MMKFGILYYINMCDVLHESYVYIFFETQALNLFHFIDCFFNAPDYCKNTLLFKISEICIIFRNKFILDLF